MTSQKPTRNLALYRDYVHRAGDRLALFRLVAEHFDVRRALYPGSYVHVTPSLVFPSVTYVDTDRRTKNFFNDASVVRYVERKKEYEATHEIVSHFADYNAPLDEPDESFDLLLSQWAGFVSQACKRYLRHGGLLVTNNSHGDASMASVDHDYRFIGAIVDRGSAPKLIRDDLDDYFIPKKPGAITKERIVELGRGVAYTKTANHYLFLRR